MHVLDTELVHSLMVDLYMSAWHRGARSFICVAGSLPENLQAQTLEQCRYICEEVERVIVQHGNVCIACSKNCCRYAQLPDAPAGIASLLPYTTVQHG